MVESSGTGKGSTRGNEDPSVARTPRRMEGRVNSSATPCTTGQPHSLYQETTSGHTLTSHRECCSIDTCVCVCANCDYGPIPILEPPRKLRRALTCESERRQDHGEANSIAHILSQSILKGGRTPLQAASKSCPLALTFSRQLIAHPGSQGELIPGQSLSFGPICRRIYSSHPLGQMDAVENTCKAGKRATGIKSMTEERTSV